MATYRQYVYKEGVEQWQHYVVRIVPRMNVVWGAAVFPETVDVNIRQLDPIPAPRAFLREQPLTDEMSELVLHSRQEIRDVLNGRDDRLLVIVGPCSIHDPKAAHEYAEKLAAVKRELEDRLVIVMRVYFEKPRTTIGWKGLINDPDLDGRFNIRKGMWLARKVLTDVLSLGLPTATEWLDPITPQYICDAISWGAIGARNTESQVHRELASGLSMPVGFKNSTDGSIKPPPIPVSRPASSITSCPLTWTVA